MPSEAELKMSCVLHDKRHNIQENDTRKRKAPLLQCLEVPELQFRLHFSPSCHSTECLGAIKYQVRNTKKKSKC